MELFIDTAEIDEIKSLNVTGLIDGVTTNPSLIAKSGRNIIETIEEICNEVSGPVSAEVTATTLDNIAASSSDSDDFGAACHRWRRPSLSRMASRSR